MILINILLTGVEVITGFITSFITWILSILVNLPALLILLFAGIGVAVLLPTHGIEKLVIGYSFINAQMLVPFISVLVISTLAYIAGSNVLG